MQPQVTAAIIAGAFAIVSPITTFFATKAYERRAIRKVSDRKTSIVGNWKGTIKQPIKGTVTEMPIEMSFTAGKKIIEGHCILISHIDNTIIKLKFTGGFYHQRFIKFDYKNEDETVMQFGSSIIDLYADGRTMVGKYVGYGSLLNEIVLGDVKLYRVS